MISSLLINEIRDEITINTEDLSNIDGDSKLLLDISNKNNLKIEKCERFSSGIKGNSKNSMNNSYHKELLKKDIKILENSKVVKIISKKGRRASQLKYSTQNKELFDIKFKIYFINCGPISTHIYLLKII